MDIFSLKNKVAIITGCGQGLGLGAAKALAEAGADIVGVGPSAAAFDTEKAVKALGRKFMYIQCDLIKAGVEELHSVIDNAVKQFGHVDILVNNAGIIKREDAVDFSEENWDDVMNINIKSVFFLCQAAGRQFIKQGGGKIINIASMLSYQGGIRVPSYTASKSAVKGITMSLANEWAKHNINVNAIAPGYMATANTQQLRDDEVRAGQILERIPAGRWGTPEDLGGAIVFLSSKASDYINGFTIAVDGGWLGR